MSLLLVRALSAGLQWLGGGGRRAWWAGPRVV